MEANIELSNFVTPLINGYKAISDELKHWFEKGLSDRLQSQAKNLYYTNTFLHRGPKVRFRDIYYPLTGSYGSYETQFLNLEDLFDKFNEIALIGSAGSGKTTIIKHIYLTCFSQNFKIPIYIELRHLNDTESPFEEYVLNLITDQGLKPSRATSIKTLNSGKFLFLLDGYDEVYSNVKRKIYQGITSFVDKYNKNSFVISSRPGSGIENGRHFKEFRTQDLSENDVLGFTIKMVDEEERQKRILETIKSRDSYGLISYLQNPLLLAMFILSFEQHPEIPTTKSAFYRNVFDTLYSRHDGINKNSYPRERLTKLKRDDFEDLLAIFSFISMSEERFSFSEEYLLKEFRKLKNHLPFTYESEDLLTDLRTTISILTLDGLEYRFPHKSLQEYFAVKFIETLSRERKRRAYEKIVAEKESLETQFMVYFWTLALEMDRYDFLELYIIPKLKEFKQNLSDDYCKDRIYKFFDLTRSVLDFHRQDGEPVVVINILYFTIAFQLGHFLGLYDWSRIGSFIEDNCKSEIELMIMDPDEEIDIDNFYKSESVRDILVSKGFCIEINIVKAGIDQKIEIFEKYLSDRSESLDDILS